MIEELKNGHLTLKSVKQISLQKLSELRNCGKYVDVTLRAGDFEIKCHKLVLCCCCQYFEAMFANFCEDDEETVEMQGLLLLLRRRQRDENQMKTVNLTKNIGVPVKLPKIYFGQGSH